MFSVVNNLPVFTIGLASVSILNTQFVDNQVGGGDGGDGGAGGAGSEGDTSIPSGILPGFGTYSGGDGGQGGNGGSGGAAQGAQFGIRVRRLPSTPVPYLPTMREAVGEAPAGSATKAALAATRHSTKWAAGWG